MYRRIHGKFYRNFYRYSTFSHRLDRFRHVHYSSKTLKKTGNEGTDLWLAAIWDYFYPNEHYISCGHYRLVGDRSDWQDQKASILSFRQRNAYNSCNRPLFQFFEDQNPAAGRWPCSFDGWRGRAWAGRKHQCWCRIFTCSKRFNRFSRSHICGHYNLRGAKLVNRRPNLHIFIRRHGFLFKLPNLEEMYSRFDGRCSWKDQYFITRRRHKENWRGHQNQWNIPLVHKPRKPRSQRPHQNWQADSKSAPKCHSHLQELKVQN